MIYLISNKNCEIWRNKPQENKNLFKMKSINFPIIYLKLMIINILMIINFLKILKRLMKNLWEYYQVLTKLHDNSI